ncbi:MAG: hypothetical protein ACTHOL_18135 [Luteibacter jiangsuensis]
MLDETWRDMERIEAMPVGFVASRRVTLREHFEGAFEPATLPPAVLAPVCEAYAKRLTTIARGVHLFRDNFDPYWYYEVLLARRRDAMSRIRPMRGTSTLWLARR